MMVTFPLFLLVYNIQNLVIRYLSTIAFLTPDVREVFERILVNHFISELIPFALNPQWSCIIGA